MSITFQKRKEDFLCEHCGKQVIGDGYTNHCPHCLWSKHVDEHPGDRAASCMSLMMPEQIKPHEQTFRIMHRCIGCNLKREVRTAKDDDISTFLNSQIKK